MTTYEEVIEHVKIYGCLPEGFNQWDLVDGDGWTVAHNLARHGNLPKGFNQWELKSRRGKTVAHFAATYKHLPDDFNQWHLIDSNNRTVFETMVFYYQGIPKWFKDWDLVITDDGETCQEIYERIKNHGYFWRGRLTHGEG